METYKRLALLAFILAAFALAFIKAFAWNVSFGFRMTQAPQMSAAVQPEVEEAPVVHRKGRRRFRRNEEIVAPRGRFDSHFVSSKQQTQTHAASLVELNDGNLRAFWFSGSREGASDVTINSAVFDHIQNRWGDERVVTGRDVTQRGLHRYIAKVGNPVATRAADGSLWLFYVTVSLGGWAGSSITLITSNDEGVSWSAPRRLVTSPFINISTLVKSPPFLYADGSMGLPVYHEFATKFAEILHLDKAGNVIDKQRLAAGGQGTLQPVVLVRDAQNALVLTRYSGKDANKRVRSVSTNDGGRNWSAVQQTALHNPDAALSALVLADGRMLAVLNDQESGRESLSLKLSSDGGKTWRELRRLEEMSILHNKKFKERACLDLVGSLARSSDPRLANADVQQLLVYEESAKTLVSTVDGCHFEFSYPFVIQARNGDIHVVYTWNRAFIKHVVFDADWLQMRLKEQ